jgi:hypothetical protein
MTVDAPKMAKQTEEERQDLERSKMKQSSSTILVKRLERAMAVTVAGQDLGVLQ